jgi:putative transposase
MRRKKAKLPENRCQDSRPARNLEHGFVHDQPATGHKLRVLTVVDTLSRFCPAFDPRSIYCGEDVVPTLECICGEIGYPDTIRVDQGSEFISRDLDLWIDAYGVTLDFSQPRKPRDNAFIEA